MSDDGCHTTQNCKICVARSHGATQITHMRRTLGKVRRRLPSETLCWAGRAICVAPYTRCYANRWRSTSFLHSTQIIDRSFASRPVPSDQSPTQMGVPGPTQINLFPLVTSMSSIWCHIPNNLPLGDRWNLKVKKTSYLHHPLIHHPTHNSHCKSNV